jgi:hypothetical protein
MHPGSSIDKENVSKCRGASKVVPTLNVSVYSLTIRFTYGDERSQVHHLMSPKLGYKERQKLIHAKYTQSFENLDLRSELLTLKP